MLSIFLALLVHFLAPAGHSAVQAPISSPGHTCTPWTPWGPPAAKRFDLNGHKCQRGGACGPENAKLMDSRG